MLHEFLEFIKRMGIFLICAESILYFSPGNTYQKYIRILIGFMLLMQFMIPVKAILTGQERIAIESQVNEFRLQLENVSNERSSLLAFPNQEELITQSITEEIKSRLNNVLMAEMQDFLVVKVEIGNKTHVMLKPYIWADSQKNNDNLTIFVSEIDAIKIDKITFNKNQDSKNDEKLEAIMNIFCRELGTSKEYLEVMIIE